MHYVVKMMPESVLTSFVWDSLYKDYQTVTKDYQIPYAFDYSH